MRKLRIRILQPPLENPRDKLVRLARAIDEHFDEETATDAQRTDLTSLIAATQAAIEAQQAKRSCLTIGAKVEWAIGLCEAYIRTYHVSVPDHPNA